MHLSKLELKLIVVSFIIIASINPLVSFADEEKPDPKIVAEKFYTALTTKFPFEEPTGEDLKKCVNDYIKNEATGTCAILTNCLYNTDMEGKGIEYCTNLCVNRFLTPYAAKLKSYIEKSDIEASNFKSIRDLIATIKSGTTPNPDSSRPAILYTTTACSQAFHASGFLNIFNSLGKVKSLTDIQNILRGLGIISPTTCYDSSFYSRLKETLRNYPLNQYPNICDDNITKACLINLTNALEKDKNTSPLNPNGNSEIANKIHNLAEAIKKFADCPNETNLMAVSAALFAANTGETDLQLGPSIDEDNCLANFVKLTFKDWALSAIAPWAELPHTITRIFAALALGIRAITGYVANAFVWSFTGLPQKLGGYAHFKPIVDPATKTGIWYIMLGLANIGLVIAMIFMAIATILRIEKYSWKKMLPKLLLVALLVNFSLVILGIFVDMSNYLSISFLSPVSNYSLGDTIKTVITDVSCPFAGDKSHFVPNITAVTLAIILSGIFLFEFVGLLFYVITRIITIWFCLAVSPLAFLGLAIDSDATNQFIKIWRDRFTQAIVSLPILSFSLFIVLKILSEIGTQISNATEQLSFFLLICYALLVIMLAQVLRTIAKSIGIEQVEKGFQLAKKAVTTAAMAGMAAVGGFTLGKITQSGWYNNLARGLSAEEGMAGARGGVRGFLSRGLSTQLYKIKGTIETKQEEKEQKELDKIKDSGEALINVARNAIILHNPKKVLRIMAMQAEAKLDISQQENDFMLRLPEYLRHTKDARAVYKYNPALRLDHNGNPIPIRELISRYKELPVSDVNLEQIINVLDAARRTDFINGTLGTAHSIAEIANFLETIPPSHREDFVIDTLHRDILGTTLHDWLFHNNRTVYNFIADPQAHGVSSAADLNRIAKIQRYWTL